MPDTASLSDKTKDWVCGPSLSMLEHEIDSFTDQFGL